MIDQEPQTDKAEQRYLENLANIESKNIADFMPDGFKAGKWQKADEAAISEFKTNHFGLYDDPNLLKNQLVAIYKDQNTGAILAGPGFAGKFTKPTFLLLDILLAAKKMAPWSKMDSIGPTFQEENDQRLFTSFVGSRIELKPEPLKQIINGVGDPKYTNEQRKDLMREYIATCVHESVHLNNDPNINLGGPDRVFSEISSTTEEYLCFPGRNEKLEIWLNGSLDLIAGKPVEPRIKLYSRCLAWGMLVMAKQLGYLPNEDNPETVHAGLVKTKEHIESLSKEQLSNFRKKMEDEVLLSEKDAKLQLYVADIWENYPNSRQNLGLN